MESWDFGCKYLDIYSCLRDFYLGCFFLSFDGGNLEEKDIAFGVGKLKRDNEM